MNFKTLRLIVPQLLSNLHNISENFLIAQMFFSAGS